MVSSLKTLSEVKPETALEVLDLVGLPAFALDKESRIKSINHSAQIIFSYTLPEIAGKRVDLVIPHFQSILVAGKIESVCLRKDGEAFPAEFSIFDYKNICVVAVHDISERKRLEQKAVQRTKELNAFSALTTTVSKSMDTARIAGEAVGMIMGVMGAEAGWIYLVDEETGELRLKEHKGLTDTFFSDKSLKPSQFFSGRVAASGRPLTVRKASEDPRVDRPRMAEAGIESIAGVPILSRGAVLGVLGVASRTPSRFTAMDMKLLVMLGNHIGIALENARLFEKLTEKITQIGVISEVAGIINSSLSIGAIFRLLASETRRLVRYDRASINLLTPGGKWMNIFAVDTEMATRLTKGMKAPVEGTSSGWVTLNNKPFINNDLKAVAAFPLDERLLSEGIRSTVSVPLYHGTVLGSFNLDSTEPGAYSERDLEVLVPVAKHISIAIQNATLFEEISREKKEWEKTFDAITDMVWIQGPGQEIMRANRSVLKRTALPYKDVMGKKCSMILRALGINPREAPCPSIMECKEPTFREVADGRGNTFHFWTYPLLDDDGRQFALVSYCKDVTSQKKMEQHMLRSDKLASLGRLAAGIAHEINNPMGIIAGYSEALIDRARDDKLLGLGEFEDFPEYLETINKEIFRCKNILTGLLDFARPSGGTAREVDINDLVREVLLLVRHKVEKAGQSVVLEAGQGLPMLSAEPGQLRQLFMNLIINSLYFMPKGGKVTIRTAVSSDGREVETSVSDTGCGIPHDYIHKIFDPFFTTKPTNEGTGLGLAICHRIVEDHDGSIEVESELGAGTTFTVSLPALRRNG
jgi:signal transduction histidine kinase/GAF domain-containing protein